MGAIPHGFESHPLRQKSLAQSEAFQLTIPPGENVRKGCALPAMANFTLDYYTPFEYNENKIDISYCRRKEWSSESRKMGTRKILTRYMRCSGPIIMTKDEGANMFSSIRFLFRRPDFTRIGGIKRFSHCKTIHIQKSGTITPSHCNTYYGLSGWQNAAFVRSFAKRPHCGLIKICGVLIEIKKKAG